MQSIVMEEVKPKLQEDDSEDYVPIYDCNDWNELSKDISKDKGTKSIPKT